MLLFYIIMSLLQVSDTTNFGIDSQYGSVYINVMDQNNEPTTSYQITFVDTLGNGEMFFSIKPEEYPIKLLPGFYFIMASWTSERYSDWFQIESGDSLYFQFNIKPNELINDNQWSLFKPTPQDTAIINLTGLNEEEIGVLSVNPRVSSANETRIIQHDDRTYQIAFGAISNPILEVNFPTLGTKTIQVPYSSIFSEGMPEFEMSMLPNHTALNQLSHTENNPYAICRLTNDEWHSPEYHIERTVIDPLEWGDSELTRYGFAAFRGYFDHTDNSNSAWRIILAFHKRVIVLQEGADPQVYNLEMGMLRPEFSSFGKYIFYFNKSDLKEISKWAVLLNTETGETSSLGLDSVLADPTSQLRSPRIYTNDNPWLCWAHFPTSDGALLSVFEDSFRYFPQELENETTYSLPLSFQAGTATRRRSSDGNLFYFISSTVYNSLFAFNNTGSLIFEIPNIAYQYAINSAVNTIAFVTKDSVKIYNLQNGSAIQRVINNDGLNRAKLSSNGNLIGLSRYCDYFELRNTLTWELLCSYTIPTDSTYKARLVSVGSNGTSVLLITSREEWRTALYSPEGNLMWVSPSRGSDEYHAGPTGFFPSPLEDYHAISDDGSRFIFNDGAFIQILEFEKLETTLD